MATCPSGTCISPSKLTREEKQKIFGPDPEDPEGNCEYIRNSILSLTQFYLERSWDDAVVESSLHDKWDILIQTAKVTPAKGPEQDRLANLILFAREFGTLHRKKINKKKDGTDTDEEEEDEEEAILSNRQRLWTDLPYLDKEIQDAWVKESAGFTPTERENLAAFTAKLCGIGVCDTNLSFCALWLIRETLETSRPLIIITDAEKKEERDHGNSTISIADLLPACLAWFQHNNYKLLKMAVNNYDPTPATTTVADDDDIQVSLSTAPGELAVKANVAQPGFSVPRWLFWRQRFKELSRCNEGSEQVAQLGKEGFDVMIGTGTALGYDIPGEKRYWDKVWKVLDEALIANGRTKCVGIEDAEVDMDWAD